MALNRFIPQVTRSEVVKTVQALYEWVREAAKQIGQPGFIAKITMTAEAANVRTASIQVVNGKDQACGGLYLVDLWVSTTSAGAPSGTQTLAVTTGALYQTVAANQALRLITNISGVVEVSIDAGGGAQTRYVRAVVVGPATSAEPDAVTWAA
jgi:hypothetical protein